MINDMDLWTKYSQHIENQFSRGAVVLFTGAGFSLDARNSEGLKVPSAKGLTEDLWKICYPEHSFDQNTQLQDIFDAAMQFNRAETTEYIQRRFTVDSDKSPDYYSDVLSMPWGCIYTLNVDDLAEKTLSDMKMLRRVQTVSATSGHITDVMPESLNVVHLNGRLSDLPENVTFSRSQYATRSPHDPFYESLRHDLFSRPVIFIGSNLEEGPMWQHLAMRGGKPDRGERELRPRSYLVTPRLNRSKEALLSQYQIVWLQMTTKEFCEKVLSTMADAKKKGHQYLHRHFEWTTKYGSKIVRVADIPEGTKEPTEYLMGAEPEWVDAKQGRIASRKCFKEIVEEIERLRAAPSINEFLIVAGTAGTGKSSALMKIALQMEAADMPTAWIDSTQRFDMHSLKRALEADRGIRLLCIADADVYGATLSRMVRVALDTISRLIVICECRSTKIDAIVDHSNLQGIVPIEYIVPNLGDEDIEAILNVLDRENRLGTLKGMSREERKQVFQAESGRQMLVAMYRATHGEDFRSRAVHELKGLESTAKFVYGLVCVAHQHRFMLSRDEIAIACGEDIERWPRALDTLLRRNVLFHGPGETYRARHRVIANFLYGELVEDGSIAAVVRALIKVAGTKASPHMRRGTRAKRMLSAFVNHNLIKRTVGVSVGRQIYGEFEYLLAWDYHYWLHRGALELESDSLGTAENFLNQSKAIEPNDVFVDNELAYLKFKKANNAPHAPDSETLVDEALQTLSAVSIRRPDQRPHAAHIAGSQGLLWVDRSSMSGVEKQQFLEMLVQQVQSASPYDNEKVLTEVERQIRRELLSMAVASEPSASM